MLDPNREVAREEDINKNPMDFHMDPSIFCSPCGVFPSPFSNYNLSSQSVSRSSEFEISLWDLSDGNVNSSTQPNVQSPSPCSRPPSRKRSPSPAPYVIKKIRTTTTTSSSRTTSSTSSSRTTTSSSRTRTTSSRTSTTTSYSRSKTTTTTSSSRTTSSRNQVRQEQPSSSRNQLRQEQLSSSRNQLRQERLSSSRNQLRQQIRLQELKKLNLLKFVLCCLLNQNQKVREVKKLNLFKFEHKVLKQLEEFVLVQELDRLQNEKRELHKFIQHASQITLQIKINMPHQICEEGHNNSSIEILDKMTVVTDFLKFHLSWTKARCRHRSLANDGDPKKSCTSFDGCHMHQDCMSTAELEIYVEHRIDRFQGELSSHIKHRLVHYTRKIELQSFHAICEPIASANDQPASRCELTHISHSTKSPPGPNGLLDGEERLHQDSLKHQLVLATHAMNDGENIPSDGGIQSAFSYPENEGNSQKCRKIKRKVTLKDLQHFSGSRTDAAKSFAVSVSTIKRICRKNGITDWRSRTIDENIQSLYKPKDIIESIQGEGAEMGNQMAGGSRSCERELNHEQIGFLPESEKDSDWSQIRIGLMEESLTQMEITPAPDIFVSSPHEQRIEEGNPSKLPVQPSELNFSAACVRPDAINFTQIDHNISANGAFDIEQVPESSPTNLTCSDPAPKLAEATATHMTAPVTEMKDTRTVTMKATYGEDMIRFQLSLTSGIIELRKEVAERLKVGTFSIKYLDDEDDWILMTGDKDLQECFNIAVSLGRKVIKLSIHEITPS